MNIIFLVMLAGLSLAQAPKADSLMTPRQLVERHIKGVQTGDLDMAVQDYADDAVVMAPPGAFPAGTASLESSVVIGKANIRKFVASLMDKEHAAGAKGMIWRLESAPEGATVMHWTQFKGTPQEISGMDIFVVRDGRIIFQVVSLNARKT